MLARIRLARPFSALAGLALAAPLAAAAPPRFPAVTAPAKSVNCVAVADLDGDAAADLLVGNGFNDPPKVARGDGTGDLLQAQIDLGLAKGVWDAELADLDGDGRLDIVFAGDSIVVTVRATATGFAAPVTVNVGAPLQDVAVGDLNGDLRPDVVTANQSANGIRVLMNDGAGNLLPPVATALGLYVGEVAIADVDGDGRNDVLAAHGNTTVQFTVLAGDGAGSFTGTKAIAGTSVQYKRFAVVDLSGDGFPEVITVTTTGPGEVVLYANNGQPGALNALSVISTFPVPSGSTAKALALGDLDDDGDLDLAIARSGSVGVHENVGNGTFADRGSVTAYCLSIALADFDGDGAADLAGGGIGLASVFHRDAPFHFETASAIGPNPGGGYQSSDVVAADFNEDGLLDAACTLKGVGGPFGPVSDRVWIPVGNGAGTFGPGTTLATDAQPSGLAAGDLDGDANLDLAVASEGSATLGVFQGKGGAGSGGMLFGSATYSTPAIIGATEVELGDVDNDGDLDAVVPGKVSGTFSAVVLTNSGTGLFSAPSAIATGPLFAGASLVDLDADGKLDLAGVLRTSNAIVVLRGDGLGGFTATTFLSALAPTRSLTTADFDGDGILDLASSAGGAALSVRVFRGFGSLTFAPKVPMVLYPTSFTGNLPGEIVALDVDGDPRPDLAVAFGEYEQVFTLENQGSLDFTAHSHYTHALALGIASGDFDRDGRQDVVESDFNSAPLLYLLRQRPIEAPGVAAYGAGTAGCAGPEWLHTVGSPNIGNFGFALRAGYGPPLGPCWFMLATAPDFAGTQPIGGGLTMHVGLASVFVIAPVTSDAQGVARLGLSIPPMPALAGVVVHAQAFPGWLAGPCTPSLYGVGSSNGITITVF